MYMYTYMVCVVKECMRIHMKDVELDRAREINGERERERET